LNVLLNLKTLRESFEVLERKWQEHQLEMIMKKWIVIVEAEGNLQKKQNKIKIGQALIS